MMKAISVSTGKPGLKLPANFVTQTSAILARKGGGKCVCAGTRIYDPVTGLSPVVEDVVNGSIVKKIASFDGQSFVPMKISEKLNMGRKKCLKITLRSGRSVIVTPEHPFLMAEGWKRADELLVKETIASPQRLPEPLRPKVMSIHEVNLLAILLAEGNYTQRGVSFDNTDKRIVTLARRAAKAMGVMVKQLVSQPSHNYRIVRTSNAKHTDRNYVRRWLDRLGLSGKKAIDKTIPNEVIQLPNTQLAKFLAVFWMCDGYVDHAPGMTLASEKMVNQIQHLLLRFGVQSRVAYKASKFKGKVFPSYKLTVWSASFHAFAKSIPLWGEKGRRSAALAAGNHNPNIGSPTISREFFEEIYANVKPLIGKHGKGNVRLKDVARKLNWDGKWFELRHIRSSPNSSSYSLSLHRFRAFCQVFVLEKKYSHILSKDVFWDQIVDISNEGIKRVYDLTVPETHCFVANDILIHNTYTGNVFAEGLLENGSQVVVIDPLNAWWGLRSSADGKKPGYSIVIFGGPRGDLPLDKTMGRGIADLVAENPGLSCVLSLRHMRKGEQKHFVMEFAEQLFHRKGEEKLATAMHLFVDEADMYCPQFVRGPDARMLGAMEDLVRRGRQAGIGVTMITQRSASINKGVLTQTELLVLGQITGPQDKKAVLEWIKENADQEKKDSVMSSLATLQRGQFWFWSPGWLKGLFRITVRKRNTFDSSSTPKAGKIVRAPKRVRKVDLKAIGETLRNAVAAIEENNPRTLRQRITELKRDLVKEQRRKQAPAAAVAATVIQGMTRKQFEVELKRHDEERDEQWRVTIRKLIHEAQEYLYVPDAPPPQHPVIAIEKFNTASTQTGRVRSKTRNVAVLAGGVVTTESRLESITKCEAAILGVLVSRSRPVSKRLMALQSGYSPKSGSFNNNMSSLRMRGWIEGSRVDLHLTQEGLDVCERTGIKPLRLDLNYWISKLGKCERAILEVLNNRDESDCSKLDLAEKAGYSSKSGSFNNCLSRLRGLGIIVGSQTISLSVELFS